MIIGIDFDDVVADSSQVFRQFCNHHYGTNFTKEEITEFQFEKQWCVSKEEINDLWMKFEAEKPEIHPLPGAKEKIPLLADQHTLHIITNRPVSMRDSTERWLTQHLLRHFSELHFCSSAKTLKTFRTKSSVCKQIGAPILLEDHPHNAHICASDGIHVYLFDQPWNRQEFPLLAGAIIRVSCWQDEILKTLF